MTDADLSVSSLFDVRGKIALVSGGGSGIGYMIADGLAQNGAKVYIASRKEAQLRQVSFSHWIMCGHLTTGDRRRRR